MDSNVIINIIAAVAGILSIYAIYAIIRLVKGYGNGEQHPANDLYDDDEYARIVANTHRTESDRQPNSGVHFDDESVYVERGRIIRDRTNFFKLVNR